MSKSNDQPWLKTLLAYYILKYLCAEPSHGNKIAEWIKAETSGVIVPNSNSLYPLLRYLEDQGYISGAWDNPDKRCKRIYHVEASGREYLPVLEKKTKERFIEMESKVEVLRKALFGAST